MNFLKKLKQKAVSFFDLVTHGVAPDEPEIYVPKALIAPKINLDVRQSGEMPEPEPDDSEFYSPPYSLTIASRAIKSEEAPTESQEAEDPIQTFVANYTARGDAARKSALNLASKLKHFAVKARDRISNSGNALNDAAHVVYQQGIETVAIARKAGFSGNGNKASYFNQPARKEDVSAPKINIEFLVCELTGDIVLDSQGRKGIIRTSKPDTELANEISTAIKTGSSTGDLVSALQRLENYTKRTIRTAFKLDSSNKGKRYSLDRRLLLALENYIRSIAIMQNPELYFDPVTMRTEKKILAEKLAESKNIDRDIFPQTPNEMMPKIAEKAKPLEQYEHLVLQYANYAGKNRELAEKKIPKKGTQEYLEWRKNIDEMKKIEGIVMSQTSYNTKEAFIEFYNSVKTNSITSQRLENKAA